MEVFFVARFSSNGRFFQQNRRISRIVLRAYSTRKLEILRRRRGNRENRKCNRLNMQNKNSESAAHFLVHFFAAIALMLSNVIVSYLWKCDHRVRALRVQRVSWLHCISLYVISKFCIWYITTNWKEWRARKEKSFVIGTRWTKMNEKDKILEVKCLWPAQRKPLPRCIRDRSKCTSTWTSASPLFCAIFLLFLAFFLYKLST